MALQVGNYSIALDMHEPSSNVNFISHAHSDHLSGLRKGKGTIASSATIEMIEAKKGTKLLTVDKPESIELLNSGHMLGSKQLYIESEEQSCRIVYTGDYQMQRSIASEEIEIRKADILLMDSTYPYANIEFEDRDEVMTSIQHYVESRIARNVVLFGAYSSGKAQELIKICNGIGISPLVTEGIAKMNKIYGDHGIGLSYGVFSAGELQQNCGTFAAVVEQHRLAEARDSISRMCKVPVLTAVASGFARMMKFDTDVQFTLSDHADFRQALEYVDRCSPEIVYTYGSGAGPLAKNLKANGCDARPIASTRSFDIPSLSKQIEKT
ncbi:MAG: hypothetical protein KGH74_01320 [Candidatus Micrarchaeota archaeon]|nr:hypothetical protein [Candidatus Micrarchaeota archaeon]MDE1823921.1 hypothetical protein [Candidatus Micrarchaeota archaeon]